MENANYEQEIIGAWITQGHENTWVFDANGNLTVNTANKGKFVIIGTKLAIIDHSQVYNIIMSSDKRTLILEPSHGDGSALCFIKK